MKRLTLVAILLFCSAVWAQEYEGEIVPSQPLEVIDVPTAGLLARGGFRVEADIYADGGVLVSVDVGFARYFTFGISYGGANIIGSDDPEMNPEPAVNLKVGLLEESIVLPAIAVGFNSQGYGRYLDEKDRYGEERYLVKSRGIYAVASKNWDILGPCSLHGGVSYSLEDEIDKNPTVFLGLIKSFGRAIDLRMEYDFAYNDNEGDCSLVENRGYFNAALVWHLNENFSLAIEARDILTKDRDRCGSETIEDLRKWNRGISIVYHDFL